MKRVRLLTAVLVAAGVGVCFVPVAQAADTTTLSPSTEAWYQPNPTCAQASGCVTAGTLPVAPPAAAPLSPYPAGTMHVGYAGGQETARTYLALPVDGVSGTLSAARLSVPLDTTAADGSQAPETAKLQACLFSGDLTATEGSIAAPPLVSCDASAPVTYVDKPSPHLEADLGPLLQGLLTTTGIALLPDATKAAQTDAWRVVFSAHNRTDAAKTAPATVTLTLADAEEQPAEPAVSLPDENTPVVTGVEPPVGTAFAPAPPVQAPEAPVAPPSVAGPAPVAAAPLAAPRLVTVGYAYPGVWLLPLALLLLVPAVAKALTKDLVPVR